MFLAGLVFLNQLQGETEKRRLEGFVEDLKTIFSFLGAMRSYFAPANTWVHMLLHIHGLDPLSEADSFARDSDKLFSSFMSRFDVGLLPAYCSTNPNDAMQESAFFASTTGHNGGQADCRKTDNAGMVAGQNCFSLFEVPEEDMTAITSNDLTTAGAQSLVEIYKNALKEALESKM